MSKQNFFEAQLVMRLARHLILQGYAPDKITVLATYSGQMFLMKEVSFKVFKRSFQVQFQKSYCVPCILGYK